MTDPEKKEVRRVRRNVTKHTGRTKKKKKSFAPVVIVVILLALCCGAVILVWPRLNKIPSAEQEPVYTAVPDKTPAAETPEPVIEESEEPGHEETSLTAILTEEELAGLSENYPNLTELDLSGSTCYDAILDFMQAHPDIEVHYTVNVAGISVNHAETHFTLTTTEAAEALVDAAAYLPELTQIDFEGIEPDAGLAEKLREAYPEADVNYTVEILGKHYAGDTEELDLSAAGVGTIDRIAEQLKKLPKLTSINLMKKDGTCCLGFEEVAKLAAAAPEVVFNYEFELFGKTVNASQEQLAYRSADIGDEGVETIRQILPFMKNLTYLKMDMCGVSNEVCAQLRDDYPDIEVVWRVFLAPGGYSALTNAEKIWVPENLVDHASKNVGAENLKYCTKCKYLDIGHNLVEHIDFVRYMPDLEVAIIALTYVKDITPLEDCPKLTYLEIFSAYRIRDISVLAKLTNLEHLNMSNMPTITDITPVYGLTKLKRFRASMNKIPKEQEEELQSLLPDCECTFDSDHPTGANWRYDEDHNYVPRYKELRETFGYSNHEVSDNSVTDGVPT